MNRYKTLIQNYYQEKITDKSKITNIYDTLQRLHYLTLLKPTELKKLDKFFIDYNLTEISTEKKFINQTYESIRKYYFYLIKNKKETLINKQTPEEINQLEETIFSDNTLKDITEYINKKLIQIKALTKEEETIRIENIKEAEIIKDKYNRGEITNQEAEIFFSKLSERENKILTKLQKFRKLKERKAYIHKNFNPEPTEKEKKNPEKYFDRVRKSQEDRLGLFTDYLNKIKDNKEISKEFKDELTTNIQLKKILLIANKEENDPTRANKRKEIALKLLNKLNNTGRIKSKKIYEAARETIQNDPYNRLFRDLADDEIKDKTERNREQSKRLIMIKKEETKKLEEIQKEKSEIKNTEGQINQIKKDGEQVKKTIIKNKNKKLETSIYFTVCGIVLILIGKIFIKNKEKFNSEFYNKLNFLKKIQYILVYITKEIKDNPLMILGIICIGIGIGFLISHFNS